MHKRQAEKKLKKLEAESTPILLVFPAPDPDDESSNTVYLPDENLLQEIMGKYPTTAIFIPVGETLPDYRPDLQPLEPPLDMDDEDNQYLTYCDVKKYIEESM